MAIRVPLGAHEDDGANGRGATGQVAFEDLWQHRAALRDICQRIVGDAATADDVVQETYLRALRNLDRLEERPSLMPWLATVARRRSIDELRRRRYQRPVEAMPDESTKPELDPGEHAGVNETVARVRDALTALTERERELLMRQVNQGLSLSELAHLDHSSVASVRSVLSRARTKLRDALTDAGVRVMAPVGALGTWVRRRVGALNARIQRVSPVVPGGYERIGEMASAGIAAAALAISGALPSAAVLAGGAPATLVAASTDDTKLAVATGDAGDAANTDHARIRVSAAPGDVGVGPAAHGDTPGGTSPDGSGGSQGGGGGTGLLPGGTNPPAIPPAPDDPLGEPDPDSPDDTDVLRIGYAEASDEDNPAIVAMGESECQAAPCRVVWISTDGGGSWEKHRAEGLDGHTVMVTPLYEDGDNRLYAMSGAGLQVSTDEGEHWESVLGPSFDGSAAILPNFAPGGDQRIFLGAAPTWSYDAATNLSTPVPLAGLPGNPTNFAFAPDYPDTQVVFAGTTDLDDATPVVFKCGDECGVADAVELPNLPDAPMVRVSSAYGDDETVAAWAGRVLYVSTDGGATFDEIDLPDVGVIRAVHDDGDGNFFIAAASPGHAASALYRTRDFEHFTTLGGGTPLVQGVAALTAVSDDLVLAAPIAAAGGGLYCSTDGGTTWATRCSS